MNSQVIKNVALALVLAVLATGASAAAAPAAAHAAVAVQVINTGGDGIASRSAPRLDARNGYGAPAGASVTALCFGWGEAVGPFSNRLWWSVAYAGRTFWAPDRYLSTPNRANQPYVGATPCGQTQQPPQTAADRAASYARSLVGQVWATGPDAALFPAWSWAPGANGEWSGDCIKLVSIAWTRATGNANHVPRAGDAIDVYRWYRDRGRIRGGVPPVGAVTFYDIARPWGHTAISVGGGQVVTTRGMDGNRYANQQVPYNHFAGYLGWAMP